MRIPNLLPSGRSEELVKVDNVHVLVFDDAVYSGKQFFGTVFPHIKLQYLDTCTIHLVFPFVTRRFLKQLVISDEGKIAQRASIAIENISQKQLDYYERIGDETTPLLTDEISKLVSMKYEIDTIDKIRDLLNKSIHKNFVDEQVINENDIFVYLKYYFKIEDTKYKEQIKVYPSCIMDSVTSQNLTTFLFDHKIPDGHSSVANVVVKSKPVPPYRGVWLFNDTEIVIDQTNADKYVDVTALLAEMY